MKKVYLILFNVIVTLSLFSQDYSKLYIIGSATPVDWDCPNAIKMNLVEGSDAVFTWTGPMKSGEFKFLNAADSWDNSFTASDVNPVTVNLDQSYNLLFRDGGDKKFIITTPDTYKVTVDMRNLSMLVSKANIALPTSFWAIGTAVPNGKMKITPDPNGDPFQFRYIGELIAGGDLKFISTETVGSDTKYIVPEIANIEIKGTTNSKLVSDATVSGWSVSTSGTTYKIKLNIITNSVNVENQPWSSALYLVGGATAAGWNAQNAIPFVIDPLNPYLFVFDGALNIGSAADSNKFKIIGQNTEMWPNALHPFTTDEQILGSKNIMINGSLDNKWIISSNQEGRYLIKVDLLYETFDAQYLEPTTLVVPINGNDNFTLIPLRGSVDILISGSNLATAELIDLSGRKIDSGQNNFKISLGDNLPNGIYILKINSNNKKFINKVVIK